MEFIVLTIIAFLCGVYCCELPVIKGFEFLIYKRESFLYLLCCGFIATYIFYIVKLFVSIFGKKQNSQKANSFTFAKQIICAIFCMIFVCSLLICVGFKFYEGIDEGTKLAYVGSIIGSGMAMLGVVSTILYTNQAQKEEGLRREKEKKEEFSVRYRPILKIENKKVQLEYKIVENPIYEDNENIIKTVSYDNHKEWYYHIDIQLENIGRGEIIYLKVFVEEQDKIFCVKHLSEMKDIFPYDKFQIKFDINFMDYDWLENNDYNNEILIKIQYTDCMGIENDISIPIYINNISGMFIYNEGIEELQKISDNDLKCIIGSIRR